MIRLPPSSKRTATLFPSTALFRSDPRLPELGHRWLAPADAASADHAAAWRAHRLGLGVTEGIAELGSDQTLWLEANRSEEHTSELQSLMCISYAVFCLQINTSPTPRNL